MENYFRPSWTFYHWVKSHLYWDGSFISSAVNADILIFDHIDYRNNYVYKFKHPLFYKGVAEIRIPPEIAETLEPYYG